MCEPGFSVLVQEGFPLTALRELRILRELRHANIVRLVDIVSESQAFLLQVSSHEKYACVQVLIDLNIRSGAFYLVFEYMEHDLHGLLDSGLVEFSVSAAANACGQLLVGDYL